MKIPEPITWTCEKTGIEVVFTFRNPSGWGAHFPRHSIKALRILHEKGIKLPWPEVPEEFVESVNKWKSDLKRFTRGEE